jgi:hypothetical protein
MASPPPVPSSPLGKNSPLTQHGPHPLSSSPSPAPKQRTTPGDLAWLLSPPPIAWNAACVSTTLHNAPAASYMATTPSAAPMTPPADGAQANTSPPTTLVQSGRTSSKVDHAPTPLSSVQGAQVTTTPTFPNVHHALTPLMSRWTSNNFILSYHGQTGLIFYFGCVGFLRLVAKGRPFITFPTYCCFSLGRPPICSRVLACGW